MELKRDKFDKASSGKGRTERLVSITNGLSFLFVPRSISIFLGLMILFIIGLWMSSYLNDAAMPILRISLQLLVIVALVYLAFGWVFRASSEKNSELFEDQIWRRRFFWIAMGGMVLGALVLVAFVPTTASLELLKRFFSSAYEPQLNDVEIRLSTSFMPLWAQVIFAAARRFAAAYCMLEFFLTPLIIHNRKQVGTVLIFLLVLFVFSTLDRAIPVFYFAMSIVGLFLVHKLSAFKNKYVYLNLIAIVAVVVLFKNIQYGEIRSLQYSTNSDISRSLSNAKKEKPKPQSATGAIEKAPVANGATDTPATPAESKNTGSRVLVGVFKYVSYAGSSLLERVLLSPVAMSLYASESYNEKNFLHWSGTRLFSFFGIGRYIPPFEKGKLKYHDAFPVTLIGDLWRNGGSRYIPYYALFLAIILFLVDRRLISSSLAAPLPLRVLSLFGVLYLFYGNAFNSTSWLMIGGSLIIGELLRLLPIPYSAVK